MQYAVLGSVEARRADEVINIGGPQQRRLLALLLSQPGQPVSVARLVDCLWPDGLAPDGAGKSVKSYVSRLRRAIGEPAISTVDEGYQLELNGSTIDAVELEALIVEAGTAEPGRAVVLYDRALKMWRGPAYGELGKEWWLLGEANRLNELRVVAMEERAEASLSIGHHHRVIAELERLIVEQPTRERPITLLMHALYGTGRHAEALREFQAFRERLADETGLDPSIELVALERSMAAGGSVSGVGQRARLLRGYSVHGSLGEGAFGRVFAATQPGTNREVAIKAIRADFSNSPEFIQRFEAEAQLVARLEHPHIVPLYDYWREPSGAYLVFRLLLGGTAYGAMVSDGPFGLSRVSRLVEEVGTALLSAHTAGVVHCDIKPSNVMFDESGNAYLLDFGIAVRSSSFDESGERTRAYAAPELAGRAGDTVQSDIFSFGCMLWELLTAKSPLALMAPTDRFRLPSLAGLIPDHSADLDAVLARATAANADARYESMAELIVGWRQAVGRPEGVLTPLVTPLDAQPDSSRRRAVRSLTVEVSAAINPYKGLRAFAEADVADYFGRADVALALHQALSARSFVAVVGPSGSGKSSLVHAGVIPLLRRDGHRVATMVPGDKPTAALRQALRQVLAVESDADDPVEVLVEARAEDGGGIVLIVDQFEECWTLAGPAERERFLSTLGSANRFGVCCVVTVRADLYDRPLQHALIGQLVADGTFALLPLSPQELEDAIVRPADRLGVSFDDGVVSAIVAEANAQPASLPLLQFAMAELYERRVNNFVTMTMLTELGGLGGAIGRRAEDIYASLEADKQAHTRELFGRLVAPGQGSPDTRRRARLGELSDTAAEVADLFVRARLLVADRDQSTREPIVEVAHEALLTSWPRLRGWLEADRAWLSQLQHLAAATREWQESGHADSELYRGSRLETVIEALPDHGQQLSPQERDFIESSRAARDAGREDERRRARRLRRLLVATAGLLVLALVAGVIAFIQRKSARDAATTAVDAKRSAEIEALVGRAASIRGAHRDTAALLALEAYRMADTPRTRSALLSSFTGDQGYLGATPLPDSLGPFASGIVMPDGKTAFVSGQDNRIHSYDLDSGAVGEPWVTFADADTRGASHYIASSDGKLLLQVKWSDNVTRSELAVFDVATHHMVTGPITVPLGVDNAVFSADDTGVYATGGPDGKLLGFSLPDGAKIGELDNLPTPDDSQLRATTAGLAFTADGALAVGSVAGPVRLVDPSTFKIIRQIDSPRGTTERIVAVNGGRALIASGLHGRVRLDLAGAANGPTWSVGLNDLTDFQCEQLVVGEATGKFYCGSGFGRLEERDLATGGLLRDMTSQNGNIGMAYLTKNDTELVAFLDGLPVVARWRLDGSDAIRRRLGEGTPDAYSPDGRRLLTDIGVGHDTGPTDWSVVDPTTGAVTSDSTKPLEFPAWDADGTLNGIENPDAAPTLAIIDTRAGQPARHPIPLAKMPDNGFVSLHRDWLFFKDPGDAVASGELWTIDTDSNTRIEPTIHLNSFITGAGTDEGDRVVVGTLDGMSVFDGVTGKLLHTYTDETLRSASVLPGRRLVAGTLTGDFTVYDLDTFKPTTKLGGILGFGRAIGSADGSLAVIVGNDRSLALYDMPSGIQIGDTIRIADDEAVGAGLRPDGKELAYGGGNGHPFTVLDLDPHHWATAVCAVAGRNLTQEEWAANIGDLEPYHATCPKY